MTTPPIQPTPSGPSALVGIVVTVVVVIALFTVAGWLIGAAWSLVRLGLLVAAVSGVVWAVRTLRR